jgi:hypothetical protein
MRTRSVKRAREEERQNHIHDSDSSDSSESDSNSDSGEEDDDWTGIPVPSQSQDGWTHIDKETHHLELRSSNVFTRFITFNLRARNVLTPFLTLFDAFLPQSLISKVINDVPAQHWHTKSDESMSPHLDDVYFMLSVTVLIYGNQTWPRHNVKGTRPLRKDIERQIQWLQQEIPDKSMVCGREIVEKLLTNFLLSSEYHVEY